MPNPGDGDEFDRLDFIAAMSTQISHVLDDPGDIWVENSVVSQPSWIFVSADGTTETITGGLGPQKLVERLNAMANA